jgi:hypothetical protein
MQRRQCQRFTKRLEATFSSGDLKFRGISSDLSASGLFIRTQHGLTPGTMLDIQIYLPDGTISTLKGVVRRTVKTPMAIAKNGMGVELIQRDEYYINFLKTVDLRDGPEEHAAPRIPPPDASPQVNKPEGESTATKIEPPLSDPSQQTVPESIIVVCPVCNAKNRISREKLTLKPKCGKCRSELPSGGIPQE